MSWRCLKTPTLAVSLSIVFAAAGVRADPHWSTPDHSGDLHRRNGNSSQRGNGVRPNGIAHVQPFAPEPHWNHQWGDGDIRHFPDHDWGHWHHGYWVQNWYGGRFGWWWVVSGVWFFYPAPVYPYPNPYVPAGLVPPTAVAYWYFCPAANGYYPYIAVCAGAWQPVPAVGEGPPPG